MGKKREIKPPRAKQLGKATAGSGPKPLRRDSMTRTKQILNAALRVWELKNRARYERPA